MSSEVSKVMRSASLSDWFLLYNLAKNMERSVFSEFIKHLADDLTPSSDTLPLKDIETKRII